MLPSGLLAVFLCCAIAVHALPVELGDLRSPDHPVPWKNLPDAPKPLKFVRTAHVGGDKFLITSEGKSFLFSAHKATWSDGPKLNTNGHGSGTLTRIGNHVCIVGGFKDSMNPTAQIACADVTSSTLNFVRWKHGLVQAREQQATVALDADRFMVCGGAEFDLTALPNCETCSVKAQTCKLSAGLPYGLNFGHAATVNGTAYIFGHWLYQDKGFFDGIARLSADEEQWEMIELDQSSKSQIGTDFTVVSTGDSAYLIGGDQEHCYDDMGHQHCKSVAARWNPADPTTLHYARGDKYGDIATMHRSHYQAGAIVFNGQIVVFGGCTDFDCGVQNPGQTSVESLALDTPVPALDSCEDRMKHFCSQAPEGYCCGCVSGAVPEVPGTPNCYSTQASKFCNTTCPPVM